MGWGSLADTFSTIGGQLRQDIVDRVDPGLLFTAQLWMHPEGLKHTRQVYGILDLLGDLGGVTEVIMLAFGFFLYPIAEHSFTMKAAQKLFLAKTSDDNLLKNKLTKYTDESKIPESLR